MYVEMYLSCVHESNISNKFGSFKKTYLFV